MKKTSLVLILLTSLAHGGEESRIKSLSTVSSIRQAKLHPIISRRPAIDFFEGAVLGNGGLGAVVTTRPDAVVIRFGHNDVWDIRLAEDNREKIGTFEEIFEKVKAIPKEVGDLRTVQWYREYMTLCRANYAKPYPRPFPCGSVVLWFDRREAELLGHRLDIDSGLCRVDFLVGGQPAQLELFVDMTRDLLWARMLDASGKPAPAPFKYVNLLPDPETPGEFPGHTAKRDAAGGTIAFRQVLPLEEVSEETPHVAHPRDQAFSLSLRVSGTFDAEASVPIWSGTRKVNPLEGALEPAASFIMCVRLEAGKASAVDCDGTQVPGVTEEHYRSARSRSRDVWRKFWGKSGVVLDDEILERTWYWNLYFLRCSLRQGVTCPGLYANWSYGKIGTKWHGDYHLNYNVQQPFWVTFSSNHIDLHLPYVDMVQYTILPVSKAWARDYYKMRGAFFPHSAYPVKMTMSPYPVPTWGWEVFETPWAVQSLWWHYTYTMDRKFLEERAFGVIKEAVLFLVDYMKRPDAHGKEWGDDRYHIFPSVPPELYGLRPGFDKNYDTIVDLSLTRFVFDAYLEACEVLDYQEKEKSLVADVTDILEHFPEYPRAPSQRGEVFVSVEGEDPETVYNVPASLVTVFPGEQHGLHSSPEEFKLAANTYRNQQNEGGNDIVFLNAQAARLGLLDLEKFKRQIEYCLLPNGTCTDKVLQIHGRYTDTLPFDYMAEMGIWFENFALPFVINECLLQGYNGELRFFPNWPKDKEAEFRSLRTVGAFLVSARHSGGRVEWIEVTSEAGQPLRVISPWESGAVCRRATGDKTLGGERFTLETEPGEVLQLLPRR